MDKIGELLRRDPMLDKAVINASFNRLRFLSKIIMLSYEFHFSVTSWIRSEKRNKAVGGLVASLHLSGYAVDVVLDEDVDKAFFNFVADSYGLYVYDEGDHLHIYEIKGV